MVWAGLEPAISWVTVKRSTIWAAAASSNSRVRRWMCISQFRTGYTLSVTLSFTLFGAVLPIYKKFEFFYQILTHDSQMTPTWHTKILLWWCPLSPSYSGSPRSTSGPTEQVSGKRKSTFIQIFSKMDFSTTICIGHAVQGLRSWFFERNNRIDPFLASRTWSMMTDLASLMVVS